jgi:hypothetical protein
MQSGGALKQGLSTLIAGSFGSFQRIPRSAIRCRRNISTEVRPIVCSSTKVSTQRKSQNSNFGDMGDIIRPLEKVLPALQDVVPDLSSGRHKGQAGEVISTFLDLGCLLCAPVHIWITIPSTKNIFSETFRIFTALVLTLFLIASSLYVKLDLPGKAVE